jgi:hypothetical protein
MVLINAIMDIMLIIYFNCLKEFIVQGCFHLGDESDMLVLFPKDDYIPRIQALTTRGSLI